MAIGTQQNRVLVAETSGLTEGKRRIVPFGNTEVGIYRLNGRLYAYENRCAHQGGPACEGLLMPKVEERLARDKTYEGMCFNYDEWHIVCPWHSWEYDLFTGEFVVDRKVRLKKYRVVEEDGGIYLLTA
jgi:nitrite reductase/ring-hydroxylating ferredoxin subunit